MSSLPIRNALIKAKLTPASIAKEMKILKLDKTVIVKATGLTLEEIKDL